jgi:hypothetical protein
MRQAALYRTEQLRTIRLGRRRANRTGTMQNGAERSGLGNRRKRRKCRKHRKARKRRNAERRRKPIWADLGRFSPIFTIRCALGQLVVEWVRAEKIYFHSCMNNL